MAKLARLSALSRRKGNKNPQIKVKREWRAERWKDRTLRIENSSV
jgi:hypothetical protein